MYLIIHALNKAFLFILVGYIVHFFNGNTDMRQMGGVYLYSFDIAVLLFGVCFNLAGLPYSAGFIGKEFLLFQVLRDDFLSLLVRACWLVSFFFTPIYMFILTFVVIFGIKKGVYTTYFSFWNFKYFNLNQILLNFFNKNFLNLKFFNTYSLYRFQYTIVTCRTTIYLLFSFWLFFFFFGESLLMILFNFSTVTDSISSNYFMFFKTHTIFFLNQSSSNLSNIIMFYILFFTTCSFIFLLNMRYNFNYYYVNSVFLFDLLFLSLILYLFLNNYVLFFIVSYLLLLFYKNYKVTLY